MFDQKVMAIRADLASKLCNDAADFYYEDQRVPEARALWDQAAALFHETLDEAYPEGFWDRGIWQRSGAADWWTDLARIGDPSPLDMTITFLENDPWFHRTGYVKADLIRFICKLVRLTDSESVRLQRVVLAAIDFRDRREFRWYIELAKKVYSRELLVQVEERLQHPDARVQRRARWVLSAITHR